MFGFLRSFFRREVALVIHRRIMTLRGGFHLKSRKILHIFHGLRPLGSGFGYVSTSLDLLSQNLSKDAATSRGLFNMSALLGGIMDI